MKTLAYWSNRLWKVSFAEVGAKFSRQLLLWRSIPRKSGWAYQSAGKWFAVYRKDGELWFRCDGWSCKIDSTTRCLLTGESSDRKVFTLETGSAIAFRHDYKSSTWQKTVDPTYDEIDAEHDDFFLWLSRMWGDEKRVTAMASILVD